MTTTPTPTVYTSRARANRKRILIVAGIVLLVLVGFLIGRLRGGGGSQPAVANQPAAPPPSSAVPSPEESSEPPPAVFPVIQAENAAQLNGVVAEDTQDEGGGKALGYVSRDDSVRYDGVDFGAGATEMIVRFASEAGDDLGGRVEFRVDDPENTPFGVLQVSNTGGWQSWRTARFGIAGVTGPHTVFVTFDAGEGDDFVNLNWFQLTS